MLYPVTLLTLFYFFLVHVFVSVFVVHTDVLCKKGLTNRDAIWRPDRRRPKEPCIRWEYIYGNQLMNAIEQSVLGGSGLLLTLL